MEEYKREAKKVTAYSNVTLFTFHLLWKKKFNQNIQHKYLFYITKVYNILPFVQELVSFPLQCQLDASVCMLSSCPICILLYHCLMAKQKKKNIINKYIIINLFY